MPNPRANDDLDVNASVGGASDGTAQSALHHQKEAAAESSAAMEYAATNKEYGDDVNDVAVGQSK